VVSTPSKSRKKPASPHGIIEHAGARADWQQRRVRDVVLIVVSACVLYLLLCLGSHWVCDPGLFAPGCNGVTDELRNLGGPIGARLADMLFGLVGYAAWLVPFMLAGVTWMVASGRDGADDAGPTSLGSPD